MDIIDVQYMGSNNHNNSVTFNTDIRFRKHTCRKIKIRWIIILLIHDTGLLDNLMLINNHIKKNRR